MAEAPLSPPIRPLSTLTDRIAEHQVATKILNKEILVYLNCRLPYIHYRAPDGKSYRISHVTIHGSIFQVSLTRTSNYDMVPATSCPSDKPDSALGVVLESLEERLVLENHNATAKGITLRPIKVVGGYDLTA